MSDALNYIDEMPGPEFLALYAAVILATLVVFGCWARRDATRRLATPPISECLDPLEIAYFRGGEFAVIHLTVFGLLQRGYLEVFETRKWLSTQKRIRRVIDHPDEDALSPVESAVFSHFLSTLSAVQVFQQLRRPIACCCEVYQQRGEEKNLLTTRRNRATAFRAGLSGAIIILGLGGFKLLDALLEHRTNIVFLIMMMTISLGLLAVVCRRNRLTNLGKRYLSQLKTAFDRRNDPRAMIDRKTGRVYVPKYESNDALFLAMAVLGTTALDGTEYAFFHQMFQQVGGGVAAGGCGGGGCGGGGGGCGGCGGG